MEVLSDIVTGDSTDTFADQIANILETKKEHLLPFSYIGFLRNDGTLKGAFIYTNFNGSNIELHIAGKGIYTKRNLRMMFWYPFVFLKANRVTAIVRDYDEDMKSYVARLGFSYEGHMPAYFDADTGANIYGLQRLDVKFYWVDKCLLLETP